MPDTTPKPGHPCYNCGGDWYWPGDYYIGKKRWLCRWCQPPPSGYIIVNDVAAKVEGG